MGNTMQYMGMGNAIPSNTNTHHKTRLKFALAMVAMMGSSICELGNYIKRAPSLHAMMTGTAITDDIALGKMH